MVIQHPSGRFQHQLAASVAVAELGEALYIAYQQVYGKNWTPWRTLGVDERRTYVAFAQDMLEQLHLEQEERPSA